MTPTPSEIADFIRVAVATANYNAQDTAIRIEKACTAGLEDAKHRAEVGEAAERWVRDNIV